MPATADTKSARRRRPITCVLPVEKEHPLHRRLVERFHPHWLHCDRGTILDISADGMRLLTRRQLKGIVELNLWADHLGVSHRAEVVWSRRVRFRQWENGLRFASVGPEVAQALATIAFQLDAE